MSQLNGKMEFTFQASDYEPKIVMTLSPESALPQVLEAFEQFLLAAGYVFDGQVDIVDQDVYSDPNAGQN